MTGTLYIYKRTYWPNKTKKPTWGITERGGGRNTYGLFATRAIARKVLKELKRLYVVIEHYSVDDDV